MLDGGTGVTVIWHPISADEVKLSEELASLDAQHHRLEMKLTLASYRHRYSSDPADVAQAGEDERSLLIKLDQLMTRMRAVGGKLALVHKERKLGPTSPGARGDCFA